MDSTDTNETDGKKGRGSRKKSLSGKKSPASTGTAQSKKSARGRGTNKGRASKGHRKATKKESLTSLTDTQSSQLRKGSAGSTGKGARDVERMFEQQDEEEDDKNLADDSLFDDLLRDNTARDVEDSQRRRGSDDQLENIILSHPRRKKAGPGGRAGKKKSSGRNSALPFNRDSSKSAETFQSSKSRSRPGGKGPKGKRKHHSKSRRGRTILDVIKHQEEKLTQEEREKQRTEQVELEAKYKEGFVDNPNEAGTNQLERRESEYIETYEYAAALHKVLDWMWVPLRVFGKIPFSIQIVEEMGEYVLFKANRFSLFYLYSVFKSVIFIFVFGWMTCGLFLAYFRDTFINFQYTVCADLTTLFNRYDRIMIRRYFLELFCIWATALHAAVSNFQMVVNDLEYAQIYKDLYQLGDRARINSHYELVQFIAVQYVLLGLALFAVILCASLAVLWPGFPVSVLESTSILGVAMIKLFNPFEPLIYNKATNKLDYLKYSYVGLMAYLGVIFTSRLNLVPYVVSCRILENMNSHYNVRLNMAFGNEPQEGEWAVRLKWTLLYKDHVELRLIATRIGRVFGLSLLWYYICTIACVLVELSAIGLIYYRDEYRPQHWRTKNRTLPFYFQEQMEDDPRHQLASHACHLMLTLGSFWYITFIAIDASDTFESTYDIIRRHGLQKSKSNEERNFIRSMWMCGDARRKLVIAPGDFFDLSRLFISDLLISIVLFFVHILPLGPNVIQASDNYENLDNIIPPVVGCNNLGSSSDEFICRFRRLCHTG